MVDDCLAGGPCGLVALSVGLTMPKALQAAKEAVKTSPSASSASRIHGQGQRAYSSSAIVCASAGNDLVGLAGRLRCEFKVYCIPGERHSSTGGCLHCCLVSTPVSVSDQCLSSVSSEERSTPSSANYNR
jgi:hypothetical protein